MSGAGRTHELKTWPVFFEAVRDGRKTFEIRYNDDRGFFVGDVLWLREWNPDQRAYTPRSIRARVTFLTKWNQKPGYVVMAFRVEAVEEGVWS